jgi:acetoin utilization deacetylase AcuC-like enzyme
VYLRALDTVIAPRVATFEPTWMIISAGFDGHRDDPITELGLTASDYVTITERALSWVPAGRRLVMLEGGYDLDALASCTAGVLGVLAGGPPRHQSGEAATSGGPGQREVDRVADLWRTPPLGDPLSGDW